MTIKYFSRQVYGVINYYFAEDNEITRGVRTLTGQKTITPATSSALRQMGFTLELVLDPKVAGIK